MVEKVLSLVSGRNMGKIWNKETGKEEIVRDIQGVFISKITGEKDGEKFEFFEASIQMFKGDELKTIKINLNKPREKE